MPQTNINDFLDSKVARLVNLGIFATVSRAAVIDPDAMMAVPRWPKALVIDMGGELAPSNGKLWTRAMAVVIAVHEPRDEIGARASVELLELASRVADEFEGDRRDSGIVLVNDSDAVLEPMPGGGMFFTKTLLFMYEIEKDT